MKRREFNVSAKKFFQASGKTSTGAIVMVDGLVGVCKTVRRGDFRWVYFCMEEKHFEQANPL